MSAFFIITNSATALTGDDLMDVISIAGDEPVHAIAISGDVLMDVIKGL
jgi:hypothetical protein